MTASDLKYRDFPIVCLVDENGNPIPNPCIELGAIRKDVAAILELLKKNKDK